MTSNQSFLLSVIAQVRWSSLIIGIMAVAITLSNWEGLKTADASTRFANLAAGTAFTVLGVGLFLLAGYVGRLYRRRISPDTSKDL
jgi:hypothetical protein